jgi:hypothetical protein
VGKAIMYKPTPSSPMLRAMTIRLIKPRILVKNPAINRMKVPFKNFDILLPTFSKKKNSYTINYMQMGGQSMTTKQVAFYKEKIKMAQTYVLRRQLQWRQATNTIIFAPRFNPL